MILHLIDFAQTWAVAEEASHEAHAVEIPLKLILVQTGNFAVLVGLLIYFFRDKVRAHFVERQRSYAELVSRAEAAKNAATQKLKDLEEKMQKLGAMHAENIRSAQAESVRLQKELLASAHATSKRLEAEAQLAAAHEIEKAKNSLRIELLKMAVESAGTTLKTQVGEPERKRLQNDFAQKLEVIRG
jgi:F-type H+-transporting ATPase subunit b